MTIYSKISANLSDIITTLINDDSRISEPALQEELMEMYLIIGSLLKRNFNSADSNHSEQFYIFTNGEP